MAGTEMDVGEMCDRFALQPVTARVIWSRGHRSMKAIDSYLNGCAPHAPDTLPGCMDAASHLAGSPGRIWIHGDYDVDGVSGSAILHLALAACGIPSEVYIPHRVHDGYGLSARAVAESIRKGCDTLITVDCGISSPDEVALARSGGATVILTDHHEPRGDGRLPEANYLIHPLLREGYANRNLCGSAIAWKLALQFLALKGHRTAIPDLLGLAALGTVADVMPLVGENRDLVRAGLKRLASSTRPGIVRLVELARCNGRPDAGTLGFQIAPRINACGRLEDARIAFELLVSDDFDRASALAMKADILNSQRRELERRATQEAWGQQIETQPFSLARSRDWHPGIVGVVAGKMAEKTGWPAFVAHGPDEAGILVGSARAGRHPLGVRNLLARSSELLERFGGHHAAAGFTIHESKWEAFRASLQEILRAHGPVTFGHSPPMALSLAEVTLELAEDLARLEPCGRGNPAPLFSARVSLATPPRLLGSDGSHLAVDVMQADGSIRRAVGWSMGLRLNEMVGNQLDITFQVKINEFRGRRTAELILRDFQPVR